MRILKLLRSKGKVFYAVLVLLGLGNSLVYSGILYFINNAITGKRIAFYPDYDWAFYLGVILISAVCNIVSQKFLIVMTNEMLVTYESSILEKVRHATYEKYENMGKQRIYAALGDAWILAEFPRTFVASANTFIIVLCSVVYMFTINAYVAASFTFFLIVLSFGFIKSGITIKNEFARIQHLQDRFYTYMSDFLDGFREVKMRTKRADSILSQYIAENRQHKKQISIKTYTKDTIFGFISRFTWYLLIGAIVFLFPRFFHLSAASMTVCLLIVLNMLESMNFFLGSIPFYFRVDTSLKKMEDLNDEVDAFKPALQVLKSELPEEPFRSIRFEDVTYQYMLPENRPSFKLGPINLTIRAEEILFIEGGNGSGKSTFINLLSGLYAPESGNIYYNNQLITEENQESYMNKLSAIFTGNHLFSENYDGFEISEHNDHLLNLLEMVGLEKIARIDPEKKWINAQLSKGQQKRLALVYSLLESKELLILDEWAAEQDPEFRAYFYNELLPQIKGMGKTVILITHDDRYLNKADRNIRFSEGNVLKDSLIYIDSELLNTIK